MTCRRDEIQQSMNTVVSETRITLDPGFLGQNVIVLAFQVTHDLLKTVDELLMSAHGRIYCTHANSLSMLSPKPGVSTIVNAMRTPSSSSSVSDRKKTVKKTVRP